MVTGKGIDVVAKELGLMDRASHIAVMHSARDITLLHDHYLQYGKDIISVSKDVQELESKRIDGEGQMPHSF